MILLNKIVEKIKNSDRVFCVIIVLLTLCSSLMIYSSTAVLGNSIYYLKKQFMYFFLGYGFMIGILFINYRVFSASANILIWVAIGSLLLTQVIGHSVNDAKRWLEVPGTGFTFQPSEIAKIAIVVYTARVLSMNQTLKGFNFMMFWKRMWPVLITILIVMMEDFSTAFLMGLTIFTLLFIGRTSLKIIGKTIAAGGILFLLLVVIIYNTDFRPNIGRFNTGVSRIETFLGKKEDVNEDKNLQVRKAKAAIASGGFFGKGPGNSTIGYSLPLPYSDFIYVIIIAEFGLFGGAFILLLYLILMLRSNKIVHRCTRTFPAFLVVGLTLTIVLQALLHMSVAVNIVPVTGQPLPFVSMGGTSQVFTAMSFGMILSVTYSLNKAKKIANLEDA